MKAIDDVIRREGSKYTNRSSDRGGPTKYGITLKTLTDWRRRPCTAEDVEALTEAEARQIYEHMYVKTPRFDQIIDDKLRELVVDCGVLHGITRAIRYLQEAAGVAVDGKIGPQTLYAANTKPNVYNRLIAVRCRRLAAFVQDEPDQLPNIEGWINRATEFLL